MTSPPPAGWYPDPEAGGSRWRWWDGQQWAAPESGHPTSVPQWGAGPSTSDMAESTRRYGRWLRWLMIANAVCVWCFLASVALILTNGGFFVESANGTFEVSPRLFALQFVSLPANVALYGFLGVLIAWIWQAGRFAAAQGWPARRDRTLGAVSVLIPVVNFWWPYQAVRDAYPPGTAHDMLLRWWLSYLIVPAASAVLVFGTALADIGEGIALALLIAAGVAVIPVVYGWRMTRDLEGMQRTFTP